eukprot:scaffold7971_cov296-Pinguiococcus_pyrenoidosus.AAC.1
MFKTQMLQCSKVPKAFKTQCEICSRAVRVALKSPPSLAINYDKNMTAPALRLQKKGCFIFAPNVEADTDAVSRAFQKSPFESTSQTLLRPCQWSVQYRRIFGKERADLYQPRKYRSRKSTVPTA